MTALCSFRGSSRHQTALSIWSVLTYLDSRAAHCSALDWAKRLDDLKANLKAEIKAAVAAGAFVNQSSAKYVYEYVVSLVVDKQSEFSLSSLHL